MSVQLTGDRVSRCRAPYPQMLTCFSFFLMAPSVLNDHVPRIRFGEEVRLGLRVCFCSIPRFWSPTCSLSGADEQHCGRTNMILAGASIPQPMLNRFEARRNEMRRSHTVTSCTRYLGIVYAMFFGSSNLAQ